MDYGIGIPSYIDAWREVKAAEEAGFTHAWFFDSQLIYSDVWATMALAAHHTSKIKLGTFVAIPSNRLAPVTAAAAASVNKIAPGRVIIGMGTGYTGRNTMGLPALGACAISRSTRAKSRDCWRARTFYCAKAGASAGYASSTPKPTPAGTSSST